MAASAGSHYLRGQDFLILGVIYLELLCMAKMLEYLSVFIGYC